MFLKRPNSSNNYWHDLSVFDGSYSPVEISNSPQGHHVNIQKTSKLNTDAIKAVCLRL